VPLPVRFIGVDFSGAKRAGRKIWLTEGRVKTDNKTGDPVLNINRCRSVASLADDAVSRDQALSTLRTHIVKSRDNLPTAYGMDFPFTLPRILLGEQSWKQFILSFTERFSSPEQFREWCRQQTEGREHKRRTEQNAGVPFAAYNLRLYRQTYYGIREILQPLMRNESVWIPPMQNPDVSRPWLMETCPASALKRLHLYQPYKGAETNRRRGRERILSALLDRGDLILSEASLRDRFIDNSAGDALDSLIAALIAFWNAPNPIPSLIEDSGEGYVYR
jgi:hypothetical protein